MDTLWLRELPLSGDYDDHTSLNDELLNEIAAVIECKKTNSGIDTAVSSESPNQIQDSSLCCTNKSVRLTKYGVELNQLGTNQQNKGLNDEVGIELVPISKQHATAELQPNLDISDTTVPSPTGDLKFSNSPGVANRHLTREQSTLSTYEPLSPVESDQLHPYDQLKTDMWEEIFPDHKNRQSTSAAEEEVYEVIGDRVQIIKEEQHGGRPLPGIPTLSSVLYDHQNTSTLKSIRMKIVSPRIWVTIAASTLALVLVVFLIVYILKGELSKQNNDASGKRSFFTFTFRISGTR